MPCKYSIWKWNEELLADAHCPHEESADGNVTTINTIQASIEEKVV